MKNIVEFTDWRLRGIYVNNEFHSCTALWWAKHETDVPTDFYKRICGSCSDLVASTNKEPGAVYQIVDGKLKYSFY